MNPAWKSRRPLAQGSESCGPQCRDAAQETTLDISHPWLRAELSIEGAHQPHSIINNYNLHCHLRPITLFPHLHSQPSYP